MHHHILSGLDGLAVWDGCDTTLLHHRSRMSFTASTRSFVSLRGKMKSVDVPFGRLPLCLLLCLCVVVSAKQSDLFAKDNSARFITRQDALSSYPSPLLSGFCSSRKIVVPTGKARESRWPLLTLDGGGLRGIVTTEVLIEVENAMKRALVELKDVREPSTDFESPNQFEIDLADYFNAIAGVSTGSWIACYLASKGGHGASKRVFESRTIIKEHGQIRAGSVEGLRVLFIHYASQIYPTFSIRLTWAPKLWRPFVSYYAGYNRPRYPVRQLESTLDLFLGQTSFLETGNTTLMVLTYDLIRKAAVFFVSDHIKENEPETFTFVLQNEKEPRPSKAYTYTTQTIEGKNFYMADVARASSAAPTVYEAKRFTAVNDESFKLCAIDGGIMSNNPTLMAFYYLLDRNVLNAQKIRILSIGVGIPTGRYRMHSASGAYQWFVETNDFLAIMMNGGSEYIQTLFASLYYNSVLARVQREKESGKGKPFNKNTYLRIQLAFDTLTAEGEVLSQMYNAHVVEKLQDVGKQVVKRYKERIQDFVEASVVTMLGKPSISEFKIAFLKQFEKAASPSPTVEASPSPTPVEEPSLAATEEKPSLAATEEKPSLAATEEKPSLAATQEKPSLAATQEKPSLAVTQEKPSLAVTEEEPSLAVTEEEPSSTATKEDVFKIPVSAPYIHNDA